MMPASGPPPPSRLLGVPGVPLGWQCQGHKGSGSCSCRPRRMCWASPAGTEGPALCPRGWGTRCCSSEVFTVEFPIKNPLLFPIYSFPRCCRIRKHEPVLFPCSCACVPLHGHRHNQFPWMSPLDVPPCPFSHLEPAAQLPPVALPDLIPPSSSLHLSGAKPPLKGVN